MARWLDGWMAEWLDGWMARWLYGCMADYTAKETFSSTVQLYLVPDPPACPDIASHPIIAIHSQSANHTTILQPVFGSLGPAGGKARNGGRVIVADTRDRDRVAKC